MSRRRWWLIVGLLLVGCSNLTPSQLQGTATVFGCWPFGYTQPRPTKTTVPTWTPTVGTGTPTPTMGLPTSSPTVHPTYGACTPLPRTPTLTPSPTPSPTPWTRPTSLPSIIGNSAPVNLSNQAGVDTAPALAVHPADGWIAVVWANWLPEFPDDASIMVRVQDPASRAWHGAISVNTSTVHQDGGQPAIAIDGAGVIHVVFTQDGHTVYTMSVDHGQTWRDPAPILGPAGDPLLYQLHVDQGGDLHLLYSVSPAYDVFQPVHAVLHDGLWQWQDGLVSGSKSLYGDLTTVQLPNDTIRTVIAVGCRPEGGGCQAGQPFVVTQDGAGPWIARAIPNTQARITDQVIDWIDVLGATTTSGDALVCVAWGQYSASGLFASCSADGGTTFEGATVIAYHDTISPPDGTPDAVTPTPAWDMSPRGYHPALVYDAGTDRLMAVWQFREPQPADGSEHARYLVWSWRDRSAAHWTPLIDGPVQEPPLRLLDDTRRSAAQHPRVVVAPDGLAWVTWIEVMVDESIDVYLAPFTPGALVTGGN